MKRPSPQEGPAPGEDLARLRKSEARLRAILREATDGILTASEEGVVESFNPAAERIFGWSAEEIVGQPLSLLMPEAERGEHGGYLERYLRTGEAHVLGTTVLVEARRKDGAVFPMELSVSEVRFEEGRFFLGILRDASASRSAEEALADSTERLGAVLNAATELAIIATEPGGTITLFNRGAERMLGFTAQEVVGEASPLIFHRGEEVEECGRGLARRLERPVNGFGIFADLARAGLAGEREWTWVRKDGATLLVLCSITALYDAKGFPSGFLWIGRDVTETRRQERALRESEERFRTLSTSSPVGVFQTDAEGQCLYTNPRWCEITGLGPEESLGVGWIRAVHPDDQDDLLTAWRRALLWDEEMIHEFRFRRPGGEDRWVQARAAPVRSEGGGVRGYVGTTEDITERKRAEEALRDSEARTRAIIEQLLGGLVTITEEGIIELVNPAAQRMFGYTEEDLVGRHLSLLLPETVEGDPREYLRRAHRQAVGRVTEWEARRKSGAVFPVEVSLFEFQTLQGRRFAGNVRDLTKLREVERLKREFVSTVSHELRTPLTSIRGSLGLLAGGAAGPIPGKAGELVSIALKNSERLILLINDILDTEKIESGRMEFAIQPLAVMASVEQALAANQAYAHQYGVRLVLAETEPGSQVLADPNRLAQVLANLLSNACKFSPSGGTVDVSVRASEGWVRISVTDHGPGIREEFRPRIFQRFAQADASDARQKGGTGLGLSISKTIVENMGGRIGFETEAGRGTTFHVDLPVARSPDGPGPSPAGTRRPVLVCVNDAQAGARLQAALTQEGYTVERAATAWEARGRIEQSQYAALLMSPELPDGDGLTFVRNLRSSASGRSLPVVMVSGQSPGPSERMEGEALLILDWLSPPLERARLADAIRLAAREGKAAGKPRILHVEDDPDVVRVLAVVLAGEAEVVAARSLGEARRLLAGERFDAVILDLDLPDGVGLDLLPQLKAPGGRAVPVIVFSAAELPREMARKVDAALVKSRSTNQDLVAAVHALIQAQEGSARAGSKAGE